MGYSINWELLSNDKLLELWLRSSRPEISEKDESHIERILKDRKVIEES